SLPHRLLFGRPRGAAAQNEGLDAVAVRTTLDLQPFPQRLPVAPPYGPGELLEAAARRADDVARAALLEPGQARLADHAAVQHPDASLTAIQGLHASDDLRQRRAVVAIAGEHLIAQRIAVAT